MIEGMRKAQISLLFFFYCALYHTWHMADAQQCWLKKRSNERKQRKERQDGEREEGKKEGRQAKKKEKIKKNLKT